MEKHNFFKHKTRFAEEEDSLRLDASIVCQLYGVLSVFFMLFVSLLSLSPPLLLLPPPLLHVFIVSEVFVEENNVHVLAYILTKRIRTIAMKY